MMPRETRKLGVLYWACSMCGHDAGALAPGQIEEYSLGDEFDSYGHGCDEESRWIVAKAGPEPTCSCGLEH